MIQPSDTQDPTSSGTEISVLIPASSPILQLAEFPESLPSDALSSLKAYTCVQHPSKSAFCQCAEWGNLLCEDCARLIAGHRYCDECLQEDDDLFALFQRDLMRPRIIQAAMMLQKVHAPQSWREIPGAIRYSLTQSPIFFSVAHKTPFRLSFPLALLAIFPTYFYTLAFQAQALIEGQAGQSGTPMFEQFKSSMETLMAMPEGARIATCLVSALLAAALKVIALDFIFWACIRIFTKAQLSFKEVGTLLHFCLIPLLFTFLGTLFDLQFLSWIGLGLMIIQTTTASRASTRCGFLQGLGIMLSFIMIATLTGLLS